MSLFLITGLPRSGKSYYAVWYIATKYFDRSKNGEFTLKKEFADLKIISNIDSLKLPHESLIDVLSKYPSATHFFSYENQQKVAEKYPKTIYLVDEPQFYFPFNFKDTKVFNWIQLHGHFGQDIYFITQDKKNLPFGITSLAEQEIKALPKTSSLFFGRDLWYNFIAGDTIVDKKFKFKRSWVFKLYKSESSKSVEKTRNPFLKYMVLLLLVLAFGIYQARTLFVRGRTQPTASTPSSSPAPSKNSSAAPGASSSGAAPSALVTVPLSYLVQDGIVYVVFNGVFYLQKDFPFTIRNGPFKTLLADVPSHLIEKPENEPSSKNNDTLKPEKSS